MSTKSHLGPELDKKRSNNETVESFLARGGSITKVAEIKTPPKHTKSIAVETLLKNAAKAGKGDEMMLWFKTQGIDFTM